MSRIDRIAASLEQGPGKVVNDPSRGRAAVAVVLIPQPESLLLIRRAVRTGDRWSDQMAFPGGRWSDEDADLLDTARREAHEEVGIDLLAARLFGTLDDVAPRTAVLPPLIVRPFVFQLSSRPPLMPNHEVAGVFWVELDRLVATDVYRPYSFERDGGTLSFPGYHIPEGVVWGMTERILTQLLAASVPIP